MKQTTPDASPKSEFDRLREAYQRQLEQTGVYDRLSVQLQARVTALEGEQLDLYRTLGNAGYDKTADGWVKVCKVTTDKGGL